MVSKSLLHELRNPLEVVEAVAQEPLICLVKRRPDVLPLADSQLTSKPIMIQPTAVLLILFAQSFYKLSLLSHHLSERISEVS